MQKSVLVVDDRLLSYYKPFEHIGPPIADPDILKTPDKVALVVFTGGADVTPSLYGEQPNPKTYNSVNRDMRERAVFQRTVELGLPIVGICRGSQLICALSGGKLVQHINGHSWDHELVTDTGEKLAVSSTHHQMQLPPKNAEIVAWADPMLSDIYEGAPGIFYDPDYEYDVVFYPSTYALGIQYHPEYLYRSSRGFQYCAELVERFFGLDAIDNYGDSTE